LAHKGSPQIQAREQERQRHEREMRRLQDESVAIRATFEWPALHQARHELSDVQREGLRWHAEALDHLIQVLALEPKLPAQAMALLERKIWFEYDTTHMEVLAVFAPADGYSWRVWLTPLKMFEYSVLEPDGTIATIQWKHLLPYLYHAVLDALPPSAEAARQRSARSHTSAKARASLHTHSEYVLTKLAQGWQLRHSVLSEPPYTYARLVHDAASEFEDIEAILDHAPSGMSAAERDRYARLIDAGREVDDVDMQTFHALQNSNLIQDVMYYETIDTHIYVAVDYPEIP